MPALSSIQFVDTALACKRPFALSYTSPKQKWVIRQHLLALLQDFPTLSPSADTFVHNDGTSVYLLNARGSLRISRATLLVPLIIWVPQDYPVAPPIIFLLPTSDHPILSNHPFVHLSGLTTFPYLNNWNRSRSNLSDLAHNLVQLFAHHHPLCPPSSSPVSRFTNPFLASKVELIDRLYGALCCDVVALQAKVDEEIQGLIRLQHQLQDRAKIATTILREVEHERTSLEERVTALISEADELQIWLKAYDSDSIVAPTEGEVDAFDADDEESKMELHRWATYLAIEDLLQQLDDVLEKGVVTSQQYIKQVRIHSREQFMTMIRRRNQEH
ncbi:PREDICTED: protein ELC-like [Nelumbo nucifera]|uniref:Protein ELC-like n=2 Tax=Nelumbo nucifera TaxID=4432 RepID=A0A1U8BD99_NELNU|nr:PREDICTED: protein ELC-like [Nelumbo nucifera]DAD36636.1 TPA_asm: hypothetical protein HUJ06_007277 [Nelumbo nucifera]